MRTYREGATLWVEVIPDAMRATIYHSEADAIEHERQLLADGYKRLRIARPRRRRVAA